MTIQKETGTGVSSTSPRDIAVTQALTQGGRHDYTKS